MEFPFMKSSKVVSIFVGNEATEALGFLDPGLDQWMKLNAINNCWPQGFSERNPISLWVAQK
jgi:hypothetical protein